MIFCLDNYLPLSCSFRWQIDFELELTGNSMEQKKYHSSWSSLTHKEETKCGDKESGSYRNGRNFRHHNEDSHSGQKVRTIWVEDKHLSYLGKNSRNSVDKSYGNSPSASSSRFSSSRHSSARSDRISYSSRGAHDKRGRSTSHLALSPCARSGRSESRDRNIGRAPMRRNVSSDFRYRKSGSLQSSSQDRPRSCGHQVQSSAYPRRSKNDSAWLHDRDRISCSSPRHKERPLNRASDIEERQLNERRDESVPKDSREKDHYHMFSGRQAYTSNGSEYSGNILDKVKKEANSSVPDAQSSLAGKISGESVSMEEDMEICDTPPVSSDLPSAKWFYLDHYGIEQGPSQLCDLKRLVEEGSLQSDHLVKHSESDLWVTVENASSPHAVSLFQSVVPETVTQLVNPPEAPGNLLLDEDLPPARQSSDFREVLNLSPMEDLLIDARIEALMDGHAILPGKELETVGEALNMQFKPVDWENWSRSEGFTRFSLPGSYPWVGYSRNMEFDGSLDNFVKEKSECKLFATSEDYSALDIAFNDSWGPMWSCKGGDWKRHEEPAEDKILTKKVVLNEGFSLCKMQVSGYDDPRLHRKDEFYPLHDKKLELPVWAVSCQDEKSDLVDLAKLSQIKSGYPRGVKGMILPVVRINACVVRDHGAKIYDACWKAKTCDFRAAKCSMPFPGGFDTDISVENGLSKSMDLKENELPEPMPDCQSDISIPNDQVHQVDDVEMQSDGWYYLDGMGHEHGPFQFEELQVLVGNGSVPMGSSVFRKTDKLWVPFTTNSEAIITGGFPDADMERCAVSSSSSFQCLYPQFIGYTRGKLHELVMKSYRSRDFAAVINEVLDLWINAKQPKKEMNNNCSTAKGLLFTTYDLPACKFLKPGKSSTFADGSEEDEIHMQSLDTNFDYAFEELCGETVTSPEYITAREQVGAWESTVLSISILARIFHFLRTDFRSLAFCATTCRHWNRAMNFYKSISRQVDFSSAGSYCTDTIFCDIMNGFSKTKIVSLDLRGCTNVSANALEDAIHSFRSLSRINIGNCNQFEALSSLYKNLKWIQSQSFWKSMEHEGSHYKTRSLKQLTRSDVGHSFFLECNLSKKNTEDLSFQKNHYKRRKVLSSVKTSAILSRDAQLRRLHLKRSETAYRKIEPLLAVSLKDIMRKNTIDFFIPKVAEIEDKMKRGYYIHHGLNSLKQDIGRMCRDAMRARCQSDDGELNHMIMLFIGLITCLDDDSRLTIDPDGSLRSLKGSPVTELSSTSRTRRRYSDRRAIRSSSNWHGNNNLDCGEYSDKKVKRHLKKLIKTSLASLSETSNDGFSEGDSDVISDAESELLVRELGNSKIDVLPSVEETFDSVNYDREWGARMTKASLVPPVTRKYETIDQYVVVADNTEVQRKMKVSLPGDYAEKLKLQTCGNDDVDMDFPEVKEYKPRKSLGDEVIEQEVYGIDPYTHNLLLDSMPEDSAGWSLVEKHAFIEEVLLQTLNKQVRHLTGSGSTPMVYNLRPVVEEICRASESSGDIRTAKLCVTILKAMHNRPDDNYVAYRKGLGVVCNKEGGFSEDDFVVDFLGEVYPAWKWFEKQDGIRSLQKSNKDPAPEFYNIYLERPKGDQDGYDLVVVDAMHKANYASRICHSCHPNCEAKVTAVGGHYQIGIYTLRPIGYGEEITFDYNSVTESKEEYEASICLCGSRVCRGSYLNLTGEGAFQKVIKECHGILDRHQLMLEACELNSVSEEDISVLGSAGLGTCLLSCLPAWLIAYSASLVRFINFERRKLPEEILNYNLEEKRKYFSDISVDVEKNDSEIQAEGVYNQRLQNLTITLDKVRYVMRRLYGDARKAPPPLQRLSPEALVSVLWKGEGSLVEELLQCMAPHMEDNLLNDLKAKIRARDTFIFIDPQKELKRSLLWLRDEVRNLPCSLRCRNDAAADLVHLYAYTNCFFRVHAYSSVTSDPVHISSLDLGPKWKGKMKTSPQEYCKTYGESYCLGKLIYWHDQSHADPDRELTRAREGCLLLPEVASFYTIPQKPARFLYGPRTIKSLLARMEKQPQKPWPSDWVWQFKNTALIFGSPMLDAVLNKSGLDGAMIHWLKTRLSVVQSTWDK